MLRLLQKNIPAAPVWTRNPGVTDPDAGKLAALAARGGKLHGRAVLFEDLTENRIQIVLLAPLRVAQDHRRLRVPHLMGKEC